MAEKIVPKPQHFLILPAESAAQFKWPERQKLTFTINHPLSSYGLGVMIDPDGNVLSGFSFLALRDSFGARIETDQPEKVAQALGLPIGESGIERPKTNQESSTLPDNTLQMALEAQKQSDRAATQDPGSLSPPDGYPAIPDVIGQGNFESARVVGYQVIPGDHAFDWFFRGQLREPGDNASPSLLDAQMDFLSGKGLRAGWERRERTRTSLYARVIGNPILLEQRAQALDHRYRHALATAPGWLYLAEIPTPTDPEQTR